MKAGLYVHRGGAKLSATCTVVMPDGSKCGAPRVPVIRAPRCAEHAEVDRLAMNAAARKKRKPVAPKAPAIPRVEMMPYRVRDSAIWGSSLDERIEQLKADRL